MASHYYAHAAYESAKRMEKLHEMESKADYLAKKTGSTPKNWYEFKSSVADSSIDTSGYTSIMTVALGFVGAMVGLMAASFAPELVLPLVLAGGLSGAGVGAFLPASSDYLLEKKVEKYGDYLRNFEDSIVQSKVLSMDIVGGDHAKTNHAAELLAKRQESSKVISI